MEPHKVLIVEDEKEIRESLVDMLEIHDYEVVTAANGSLALDYLSRDTVNLIVSDVMMPEMDGFELLEAIRSNEKTELIPVIMLTAKVELDAKLKGLELGANDYITKPFEFQELHLKINNLINERKKLVHRATSIRAGALYVSQEEVFLRKLNLLIHEQLDNTTLNPENIAEHLNMSSSTFSRKLQKIAGKSPAAYLKEYRLKQAREMIRLNYGNVSEIAFKTGFASPSYFSTVYTEFFGTNPSNDFPDTSN